MQTILDDLYPDRPKRKNGINSRTKGIKNERDLAKALEKWTGKKFARVPSSGGLRWTNTVNACGDLIAQDKDFNFPFSIETKHYKKITVTETLRSNSKIFTFWEQAVRDANRANKLSILFVKGNYQRGWYVFIKSGIISKGIPVISSGKAKDGTIIDGYESSVFFNYSYKKLVNGIN